MCDKCGITPVSIVSGKWYVVDMFGDDPETRGAVAGPFDTRAEAEAERVQLNIAEDCYVALKR